MAIDSLADYFKPEVRNQGEKLFESSAVTIATTTDTQTSAYVNCTGSPRVSFSADNIESPGFLADCSCTTAKKGRLCKHMWATLLKLQADEADFLACRSAVEKAAAKPESDAHRAAKARQAEYKQRQKEQNKARSIKTAPVDEPTYPYEVQTALIYFSKNGFDLMHPLQVEDLDKARKILARVFHPDKGGAHEEILTLNKNYDVIIGYLKPLGY